MTVTERQGIQQSHTPCDTWQKSTGINQLEGIVVNPGVVGLTGRVFMFFMLSLVSKCRNLITGGRSPKWFCLTQHVLLLRGPAGIPLPASQRTGPRLGGWAARLRVLVFA